MLLKKAWQNGRHPQGASVSQRCYRGKRKKDRGYFILLAQERRSRWHPAGACHFAMLFLKA